MDDEAVFVANATCWAKSKIGNTNYATWCLSFVEDAYERSNDIELDGYATAKEAADGYEANDDASIPPKGALVFYDWWGRSTTRSKTGGTSACRWGMAASFTP